MAPTMDPHEEKQRLLDAHLKFLHLYERAGIPRKPIQPERDPPVIEMPMIRGMRSA